MVDIAVVIKSINELYFPGEENIKYGNMLYYPLMSFSENKNFLLGIKKLIGALLFDKLDITVYGNPKTVFLFSTSYLHRKDLLESFIKAANLVDNKVLMIPKNKWSLRALTPSDIISLMRFNKSLKLVIHRLDLRLFCLGHIWGAVKDYKKLDTYIKERKIQVDNLVSLCDVQPEDCYFTQIFNSNQKKTITMQHGVYTSTVNNWVMKGSLSKYMLVDNQFTIDEGICVGYKNKMLVAGPFSCINEEKFRNSNKSIHVMGVLLDGEPYTEDNICMIKLIYSFCMRQKLKMYVKCHPLSNVDIYMKCINDDKIAFYGKEISAIEFCKLIDVAIVRNSTVLIETLQMGIPTLIFSTKEQKIDVYSNYDKLKFCTIDELRKYFVKGQEDMLKQQLFDAQQYFCCSDDVSETYRKAFNQLGIV